MTKERRLQARTEPARLGFIQISRDEGGRIRNVSEGGICFEAFGPIERERLLQFWFSLDLRERVEARGRLAWLDPRREVGGLKFLDLSPKARRHLRTYLQPQAEPLQGKANRDGDCQGASSPPLPRDSEEPRANGSAFLAALAKHSLSEVTLTEVAPAPHAAQSPARQLAQRPAPEIRLPAVPVETTLAKHAASAEPASLRRTPAEAARSEMTLPSPDPSAGEGKGSSPFWNPMSFVSLDRHMTTSRHQLLRGASLGALIALTVGFAAGWYFGRERGRSELLLPAAANSAQPAAAPVSDGSAPASTIPSAPAAARSALGQYAPDNPSPTGPSPVATSSPSKTALDLGLRPRSQAAASPRNAAPSLPVRAADVPEWQRTAVTASSQAGAAKVGKSATPQQLWAAVQAGNMKAAVELADRFIRGNGVPVNCDQARVLLLVASEKNNADAIKKLHDLDKTGCPPQ